MDATAITSALWTFGPPSGIGCCQDSERFVAWATHDAIVAAVRAIGTDKAAMVAACQQVRADVGARSSHEYDLAQAERACRALRRGWLAACVRRHPGAARFESLARAVASGRASAAQFALAERLANEVG